MLRSEYYCKKSFISEALIISHRKEIYLKSQSSTICHKNNSLRHLILNPSRIEHQFP